MRKLGLTACASTGGPLGHMADRIMPAPTKELQIYRFTAVYAYFSRMASATAKNSDQAMAAMRYMVAVRNDLNELAWRTYKTGCSNDLTQKCPEGYKQTFEEHLPTIENNLYRLAIGTVPLDDLKAVIPDIAAGDLIGTLEALIKPAVALAPAAHQVGAVYRSEREVFGAAVAAARPGDTAPRNSREAVDLIRGMQRDPEQYAKVGARFGDPESGYFDALFATVRESCAQLTDRIYEKDKKGLVLLEVTNCGDFKLDPSLGKYKDDKTTLKGYPDFVPNK